MDRRRIARNATNIVIGHQLSAQTIQQLVRQMYLSKSPSYSSSDISQVMLAHRLSASLCGDMWRADGRPLDTNLVATATIAVSFGHPLQAVLVMLLHSVSLFANDVPRPELKRLLYESGVQFWHETIGVLVTGCVTGRRCMLLFKLPTEAMGTRSQKEHLPRPC